MQPITRGEAHAGSENTPQQTPLLQKGRPNKNCQDLPMSPPFPPPLHSYHQWQPIIPPFHSLTFLKSIKTPSISVKNYGTDKNHFDPPVTPHHPHLKYPPPIIPPFDMSSVEMKNNNPSTSTYNTNSSSIHTLPPFHPPPHINRNPPIPHMKLNLAGILLVKFDLAMLLINRHQ